MALSIAASCGTQAAPAPSCEQVRAHGTGLYVTMREAGRPSDENIHRGMLLEHRCSFFSEDERRCVLGARRLEDIDRCTLPTPWGTRLGSPPPQSAAAVPGGDVLALLATSKVPTLVGPFAKLRLTPELSNRDVTRQAPELCASVATIAAWCEYRTSTFPGLVFRIQRLVLSDATDDGDWLIGALRITMPAAGVRERLAAAWGPSHEAEGGAYWFDPATELRAVLRAATMPGDPPGHVDLELAGYTTLDSFIGTDTTLFGFEHGAPLLGSSEAAVRKRFGGRVFGGRVRLWPVDAAEKPAVVSLGDGLDIAFDGEVPERVTGFTVTIPGAGRAAITRALERKWGAARDDGDGNLVFHTRPRVRLNGATLLVGDVAD